MFRVSLKPSFWCDLSLASYAILETLKAVPLLSVQASINKDGSRNGAGSRNRFANSGSPDPVMGPRTSESGPSLTSAMPTSLPPQSALSRLAPGQQGGISWPFAMPLGETCHIVILDPLRFPTLAGARSL